MASNMELERSFDDILGLSSSTEPTKKKETTAEERSFDDILGLTSKPSELVGPVPEKIDRSVSGPISEDQLDKWFTQLAQGAMNVITLGQGEKIGTGPLNTPPTTKGEAVARGIGSTLGAAPATILASEALGGAIGVALKGVATKFPKVAMTLARLGQIGFTEEAIRGAIMNSKELYQAWKTNDLPTVANSLEGVIIDTAFSALMAKGFTRDAASLKNYVEARAKGAKEAWQAKQEERFSQATNVTPEEAKVVTEPKTLAEAKAQSEAAVVEAPKIEESPTPDLDAAVHAKESTTKAAAEIKKVKSKKPKGPTVQQDMAKIPDNLSREDRLKYMKVINENRKGKDAQQIAFKTNIPEEEVSRIVKEIRPEVKAELPVQVEPTKPGTLAAPTPEKPLEGVVAEPEVETELDEVTGAEEHPELVGLEESIFSQTPETTKANRENYSRSQAVARSYEELFQNTPTSVKKDVGPTTWSLATDVNYWMQGGDVDIDATRAFIDKLALNADQFRGMFREFDMSSEEASEAFNDWKGMINDLAVWARRAEPPSTLKRLVKGEGGFVDLSKRSPTRKAISDEMSKMLDESVKAFEKSEMPEKFDFARFVKEQKINLNRAFVDKSANIYHSMTSPEFFSKYGNAGYITVRNMNLSRGGTPYATAKYKHFVKSVYGGLNANESRIVDRLSTAVRMVDIGKYEPEFDFPEGLDPASMALYLDTFDAKEGLDPARAYELYHVNPDGRIGGRVGIGFDMIKSTLRDLQEGQLIGKKEEVDLGNHKYKRMMRKTTTLAEIFDNRYQQNVGSMARNVYDSGIEQLRKKLDSNEIVETNWKLTTFETFIRAYGRVAHNQAQLALYNMAKDHPTNPFVFSKWRPSEPVEAQPTTRAKLKDSIFIKATMAERSDYESIEWAQSIISPKRVGKNVTLSKLLNKASLDELKMLDLDLGPQSYKYIGERKKTPKGWIPTNVFVHGHQTEVFMEPEFAKEWIVNSRDVSGQAARLLRYATMTPIVKMFATGIEPAFAVPNIVRDVTQIWFAGREFVDGKWQSLYNPVIAVAAGQMAEDAALVSKDVLFMNGLVDDLLKYGGGMEFLVLQSRPFARGLRIDSKVDKVFDILGAVNERAELLTRTMMIVRSLKNQAARAGISLEDARKNKEMMKNAVFAARDYMDFAQGGWATKLLDQVLPYFNATFVGTRTFTRAFLPGERNKQWSWFKLAQFAALATGLYMAFKESAPKTMKELENDERTIGNFVFPIGDWAGFQDDNGQIVYPFITLPVDNPLRPLKKLFEAAADNVFYGKAPDLKPAMKAFGQLSPVDVNSLPPLEAAIFEYANNYDLYRMQPIRREGQLFPWPDSGKEVIARGAYKTPEPLVQLGELTGASPERLRTAMQDLISRNSTYARISGALYNEMFGQFAGEDRQKHLAQVLSEFPVINRFVKLTRPYNQFAKLVDESTEAVNFRQHLQRLNLDTILDAKESGAKNPIRIGGKEYAPTDDGIVEYISSVEDRQDSKKLDDRYKRLEKMEEYKNELPHIWLWKEMEYMTPEARANVYVERIHDDPELYEEFKRANSIMNKTKAGSLEIDSFKSYVEDKLSRKEEGIK